MASDHLNLSSPTVELDRDEILLLLIEECGEVIQAATKCLRFGFDREWPGYGKNSRVLSFEVGDLIGCIEALPLDADAIYETRISKIRRATEAKASIGDPDKPAKAAFPIIGDEGGGP